MKKEQIEVGKDFSYKIKGTAEKQDFVPPFIDFSTWALTFS